MMVNFKGKKDLNLFIILGILVSGLVISDNYLSKKFNFALLIETYQKGTGSYLRPYISEREQIRELREFIKKHPHTPEVINKYIKLGKIFEKIESRRYVYWTYQSAIRAEGDNPEIIKIYLLLIELVKDKKRTLFKVYKDVTERFPDDKCLVNVYREYAQMLEKRKQKEEALKFYEIAAKYASRKEQLNILKKSTTAYLASGDNQKALEVYNKILKNFPDMNGKHIIDVSLLKAHILFSLKKYNKAIDVCNKALASATLEKDKKRILEQMTLKMQWLIPKGPLSQSNVETSLPHGSLNISDIRHLKTQFLVSSWDVIGPFPNPVEQSERRGLDIIYPPEKEPFDFKAKYRGVNNKSCEWFSVGGYGDYAHFVNLDLFFDPNEHVIAYAHTYLESSKSQDCVLSIGSDDGIKIWLNGKEVLRRLIKRAVHPNQDKIFVHLIKGINEILVKVEDDVGEWGFYFEVKDKNEERLKDIQYQRLIE